MRYIQRINEDGTSRFDPVDSSDRGALSGAIHGDIQTFVSPVDGTVISDRKQLREHNKRNNVVNYHEFDGQEQAKKQKERERLYTGERTNAEVRRDRMAINETIERLSRR